MFSYIVNVKHNKFKNRHKRLIVATADHLLKINKHFDVWSAKAIKCEGVNNVL